jgi:uncharacterized protein YndB with AHSA1/START domain
MTLAFSLDRTVEIRARRAVVFSFFTDPARFARWWGEGSTIEPVVGGSVRIVYPGGSVASGVVRELVPDERIAFTFGYEDPAKPIPPGGSLVTITLADAPDGTRVVLRHDVADAATRDQHVQGWIYQLAVFAKVASDAAHARAGDTIAAWFAAWSEPEARCRELLAPLVAPEISFRDGFGCTSDADELVRHIAACQRFMPGIRLEPRGAVRQAHGTVLADWAMVKPDGTAMMQGTNVFSLTADGAIASVVGLTG